MSGSEKTETYQVLSDEPGLLFHRPRRQLVQVLVLYALLPLICAAAGSYITYTLGSDRSDRRIAALEKDLAERRAARAEMDAQLKQQVEQRAAEDAQLRKDACVAFDRIQPRDAAMLDLRRRYGCTGNPKPAVAPGPTSVPSGGSQPAGQRPAGGGPTAPRQPAPAPQQPPAGPQEPQGPPGPPGQPAPPDDGLTVCLPIVGCLL